MTARRVIITATVLLALLCAGCHTVRGIGQDIQKAGEKIQDATKK